MKTNLSPKIIRSPLAIVAGNMENIGDMKASDDYYQWLRGGRPA